MNNKKIKVLLVSPYNAKHVGGIGTWSKSILDYFEKSDKYVIVFQNTSNIIKTIKSKWKIWRILSGIEDTFVIIVKLFFNLLFKNPDVIHYTSSASLALMKDKIAIYITKKIFGKRFIIHWHFGRIPELCMNRNKEYFDLIKVVQMANENIVLDKKSLDLLLSEGCNNVCYIPNPLTTAVYDETKDLNIEMINSMRNEGEVLFVGHIMENKGVFELVKCCTNCKNVKKLTLVGPILPGVKEKILTISKERTDLGWLEFKGELRREDVYSYYQNCTLFCLPSYTEGFPYVILEAMAFGCPIIATDVGAIAEMLEEGSGIVIQPRNYNELFVSINKLISEKTTRDIMGCKAYNRVMSVYTREEICKQYSNIWSN